MCDKLLPLVNGNVSSGKLIHQCTSSKIVGKGNKVCVTLEKQSKRRATNMFLGATLSRRF